MQIVRFRWLLPLWSLTLDVILLVFLVHAVDAERSRLRHPPALWHQVYGHVDPGLLREGHVPAPFNAVALGTVPAAFAASLLLPNGWLTSSPFDLRWVTLYFAFATLFWFAVAHHAEESHRTLMRTASVYLLLRTVTVPLSISYWGTNWTMLSHVLLGSVWWAASTFAAARGVRSLYRRIKPAQP
jgi:hypothetical protein